MTRSIFDNCPCCPPAGSVLNFRCPECCAEQIRRCRPNRKLQEKMLHQLTALSGAPTREEILEKVRKQHGID